MDDAKILQQINELAREEHELFERESHAKASETIGVTLDQCWDLLRQRRAKRDAGRDPDETQLRDEKTVEGYTA